MAKTLVQISILATDFQLILKLHFTFLFRLIIQDLRGFEGNCYRSTQVLIHISHSSPNYTVRPDNYNPIRTLCTFVRIILCPSRSSNTSKATSCIILVVPARWSTTSLVQVLCGILQRQLARTSLAAASGPYGICKYGPLTAGVYINDCQDPRLQLERLNIYLSEVPFFVGFILCR